MLCDPDDVCQAATHNPFPALFHFLTSLRSSFNPLILIYQVLPEFVALLAKNKEVQAVYPHISDLTGSKVYPYGVLMLSKLPYSDLRYVELETEMDRKFLMAEFKLNNEKVAIGTVHLESLATGPVRRKQLQTINETLQKNYRHWIVMGDFNFDNEINFRNAPGEIENVALNQIMPEAIDTWDYVNPESKSSGKTYDSVINKMLGRYERMRYDRVMLHSQPTSESRSTWVPVNARLIGTEAIQEKLWPSDHFGVFVEFLYNS